MRLSIAFLLIAACIAIGANSRTAVNLTTTNDPTTAREQSWYVVPQQFNVLLKDVDTAFAHLAGVYADSINKAKVNATRLQSAYQYITSLKHIDSSATLLNTDMFVMVDASDSLTGVLTVTLPAISWGKVFVIKNTSDGDTAIAILPNGTDKIDGAANDTLATANASVSLIGDTLGADSWRIW